MLMMGQREQDTSLEKRDADDRGRENQDTSLEKRDADDECRETGYIIREERC